MASQNQPCNSWARPVTAIDLIGAVIALIVIGMAILGAAVGAGL